MKVIGVYNVVNRGVYSPFKDYTVSQVFWCRMAAFKKKKLGEKILKKSLPGCPLYWSWSEGVLFQEWFWCFRGVCTEISPLDGSRVSEMSWKEIIHHIGLFHCLSVWWLFLFLKWFLCVSQNFINMYFKFLCCFKWK